MMGPFAKRLRHCLSRYSLFYASFATASAPSCPADYHLFKLIESFPSGTNSKVLRFALPSSLGLPARLPAPSGVTVAFDGTDENGLAKLLEKSYSPVSHPAEAGFVDLLVKSYPPRPGGGVGAFLCGLKAGESAAMKFKQPRLIHGSVSINKRWQKLGLIAGGTGVAPFVQIIRSLLSDHDNSPEIRLLYVNRFEEDILMRSELDALSAASDGLFKITYALTKPNDSWMGARGRGSADLARTALPPPGEGTMLMVCGTDGFVDTWAGALTRVQVDGKKQKVQGPVRGFLREAGFTEANVYKF